MCSGKRETSLLACWRFIGRLSIDGDAPWGQLPLRFAFGTYYLHLLETRAAKAAKRLALHGSMAHQPSTPPRVSLQPSMCPLHQREDPTAAPRYLAGQRATRGGSGQITFHLPVAVSSLACASKDRT